MAVQTTYGIDHGKWYAGMVNNLNTVQSYSKLNKGTEVIPYGKGVVTDGEDGAAIPTAVSTADQFNGVVMYEINRAQKDGDVAGGVPGYDMTVVSTGAIVVRAAGTVAKDDPVFLRVGSTATGDFANVVGATVTLGVELPNAKFLTGGADGELVQISLNVGG